MERCPFRAPHIHPNRRMDKVSAFQKGRKDSAQGFDPGLASGERARFNT